MGETVWQAQVPDTVTTPDDSKGNREALVFLISHMFLHF